PVAILRARTHRATADRGGRAIAERTAVDLDGPGRAALSAMKTLDLEIADTRVRLRSAFAPLAEYASAHFGPVLREKSGNANVQVSAELHWHEGHPPADAARTYPEMRGCRRLDRDLWVGSDHLVWLRVDEMRDLHLRFRWDGETLAVRGDYYHRLST